MSRDWNEIRIGRAGAMFPGIRTGEGGTQHSGGVQGGQVAPGGKRPSSTRKLQCPCCKNSVRATKAVKIMCMDCNEQMMEV